MKQILITEFLMVTILLGLDSLIQAQEKKTWQWVSQMGGRSWDKCGGVICNSKNDLYITGGFMDSLVCKGTKLPSIGNHDIFIARFDARGNLKDMWQCGGKDRDLATCITLSQNNSVIVGGLITGDINFDKLIYSGTGNRLFITSLTEKGRFSWISTLSGSGESSLFLLDADASGHIFTAGVFTGKLIGGEYTIESHGKKDIFLARLSSAGHIEKLVALGGEGDDFPTAMSVSDSGKIILAGSTEKSFKIGSLEISAIILNSNNNVNSNAFMVGLSDDFTPQWKTQLNSDEYCQVASIAQDDHGNIYSAGSFNSRIKLEDTLLISNGYSDGFIQKYNSDGKHIWSRNFGSWYYDYANQLVVDNFGGAFITGSIGDTLLVDSLTVNPLSSNNSALTIQFSPEGKATWADCISGSGRNFGNGVAIDREGNLYFSGTFSDAFMKGNIDMKSLGDQDVFLAKYYNCPTRKVEILGKTLLCPGSVTELYIKQGYNQVIWNDTIENANYIIASSPGINTVRALDKRGCVLSDTVEIFLAPSLGFSLGDDTSVPLGNIVLLSAPGNYTNYNWQDGSGEGTFPAEAEHEKPGTYTYSLSATDTLGCIVTDTIKIEFFHTQRWIDPEKAQLSIHPNPVDDLLYWSVNAEKPCQFIVEITDENGRIMYSNLMQNYQPNSQLSVDFSYMPPGLYYFRLKNDKGQAIKSVSLVRK